MKIITLCSVKVDGRLRAPGYVADIDDDLAEELIAVEAVAEYTESDEAVPEATDEVPAKRSAGGKKAAAGESE